MKVGSIHNLGVSIGKNDDAHDVRSKQHPADVRRKLEDAERVRRLEVADSVDMGVLPRRRPY